MICTDKTSLHCAGKNEKPQNWGLDIEWCHQEARSALMFCSIWNQPWPHAIPTSTHTCNLVGICNLVTSLITSGGNTVVPSQESSKDVIQGCLNLASLEHNNHQVLIASNGFLWSSKEHHGLSYSKDQPVYHHASY